MLPTSFEAEDANPEIQPEYADNQSTFFASIRVWKAKCKAGNRHDLPFGCIYDNSLMFACPIHLHRLRVFWRHYACVLIHLEPRAYMPESAQSGINRSNRATIVHAVTK